MAKTRRLDPWEIPADMIPEGMTYQWCQSERGTIYGVEHEYQDWLDAGWFPVMSNYDFERLKFRKDEQNRVIYGSSVLMQRAKTVTDRAREAEVAAAVQQRDNAIPNLMAKARKIVEDAGYSDFTCEVNISVDPGTDIPRPKYGP